MPYSITSLHCPPHSRSTHHLRMGRARLLRILPRSPRSPGDGDGERRSSLREAAAPFLHELHQQTGMVVHLTVLDGPDVVDLDKVGGRFAAAVPSRVGGHAPAHCTAGGKAILAWITPERVDALFGSVLSRSTENTITNINVLHQELSRIRRRRGVAFERGESAHGVACIAAAVRGYEEPVGSIALCGNNKSVQLERLAPWSSTRSVKFLDRCTPNRTIPVDHERRLPFLRPHSPRR